MTFGNYFYQLYVDAECHDTRYFQHIYYLLPGRNKHGECTTAMPRNFHESLGIYAINFNIGHLLHLRYWRKIA